MCKISNAIFSQSQHLRVIALALIERARLKNVTHTVRKSFLLNSPSSNYQLLSLKAKNGFLKAYLYDCDEELSKVVEQLDKHIPSDV